MKPIFTGSGLSVCLSVSQVEDSTLQVSSRGNYVDLECSLAEQRDDLGNFYQDIE